MAVGKIMYGTTVSIIPWRLRAVHKRTEPRVTLRGAAPMWGELEPTMERVIEPVAGVVLLMPVTDAATTSGALQ